MKKQNEQRFPIIETLRADSIAREVDGLNDDHERVNRDRSVDCFDDSSWQQKPALARA